MAEPVVYVYVTPGGVRREWCDRCLTTARLVVDIYGFVGDGPPHLIATFDGCTRCDPHLFE